MAASPHTREYWESQQNGGFEAYPVRTTNRPFVAKKSRTVTVASGQVLKARSFVSSDPAGKMIASGNMAEYTSIAFSGIVDAAQTVIIAGMTLTASAEMSAAEVVDAFVNLTSTKGTFNTTTAVGWVLEADPNSSTKLIAHSLSGDTNIDFNVTNISVTGTAVVDALVATPTFLGGWESTYPLRKPAGILAFDVDATSADVKATIYTEVYAYESEILWGVDTSVDVVVKADGTEVACTAYNTGAYTALMRQLYVEGTEFEIVTPTAGEELANG